MPQPEYQNQEHMAKLFINPETGVPPISDHAKAYDDGSSSTSESDEIRIQTVLADEPLRVLGRFDVGSGFILGALLTLFLGGILGYWWPDMIDWKGSHAMDPFTSRVNKEIWKDRATCLEVIKNLDAAVVDFRISAEELREHATNLVSNERYFEAIITHYAALSLVLRDAAGMSNSTLQQALWNWFFLAKQALRPIQSQIYTGAIQKLTCTIELWKAFVWKIISVQVKQKDEVIKGAWNTLCEAITHSQLHMWKEAESRSEEAYLMVFETFGKDSVKYEVCGWAVHIMAVAETKGEIRATELLIEAARMLKLAEDKVDTFDFQKTMYRLFPYEVSKIVEVPLIQHVHPLDIKGTTKDLKPPSKPKR